MKIILALHIDNTKPREEWRQYSFSSEVWASTDARQKESGVMGWEYVGEQAAPTKQTIAQPVAQPFAKKKDCGCGGKRK